MAPKKGAPAPGGKKNAFKDNAVKNIRPGLEVPRTPPQIPEELLPQQQARPTAGAASVAAASSTDNVPQPSNIPVAAPRASGNTTPGSKIPGPPRPLSGVTQRMADLAANFDGGTPPKSKMPVPTAQTSTGIDIASKRSSVPPQVSPPPSGLKKPVVNNPSFPKSSTAAERKKSGITEPLNIKKAGNPSTQAPLKSAPPRSTPSTPSFMKPTATSRKREETSASQQKGELGVLQKPILVKPEQAPEELSVDAKAGVKEVVQSSSSGRSSPFITTPPISPKTKKDHQGPIIVQSAQTPDEQKVVPKDGDNLSPNSDSSSEFEFSPPTKPESNDVAPTLPTSLDQLVGPLTDTTPAHIAEPPFLSEREDFGAEQSWAVDTEEGLYDAFGPRTPSVESQPEPEFSTTLSTPSSDPQAESEAETAITSPGVQSQVGSEVDEFDSQDTSTTCPPQPQPEPTRPESTSIFTTPQWQPQSESEISESEPQSVPVTPTSDPQVQVKTQDQDVPEPRPALPARPSETNISVPTDRSPANLPADFKDPAVVADGDGDLLKDHSEAFISHGDTPSPSTTAEEPTVLSLAAQHSALALSLIQGHRRPSQGFSLPIALEQAHRQTQEELDFLAHAADPANTDKDCVKMATLAKLAIESLKSGFYTTMWEAKNSITSHESESGRVVDILGGYVKRDAGYSAELERQRRESQAVVAENDNLRGRTEQLADAFDTVIASSVGTITPAECENPWNVEREDFTSHIAELTAQLTEAQKLLEVAPKREEMEELQQKLKDSEDSAMIAGDGDANQQIENWKAEVGKLRRELHRAQPGDADTLDQLRAKLEATGEENERLQNRLEIANKGYEGVSKQRDTLKASVESAKELMTSENQKHTEDKHDLESQLAGLKSTNQGHIGDIATFGANISTLRSQLTKVTQERDEKQDTVEDLKAKVTKLQEQIDRSDKTLSEEECNSRNTAEKKRLNSEKDHLRDELLASKLEIGVLNGKIISRDNTIQQLENQVKTYEEENSQMLIRTAEIEAESKKNEIELDHTKCLIEAMTKEEMEHIRKAKTASSPHPPVYIESSSLSEAITRLSVLVARDRRQSHADVEKVRKQSVDITSQLEAQIAALTAERDRLKLHKCDGYEKLGVEQTSGSLEDQIASLHAQLSQTKKELADSITVGTAEHNSLTETISENNHKCNEEKSILASELAEAIEKKEEYARAIASMERKIGGTSGLGKNSFEWEITGLNQEIAGLLEKIAKLETAASANDLETERLRQELEQANTATRRNEDDIANRRLTALTAVENRKLRSEMREEGTKDQDLHTRDSAALAIMHVELQLASMRVNRAFNGVTHKDHEIAITVARDAFRISEWLGNEALMAQSKYWLAVAKWYAGNTEDAGAAFAAVAQNLLPQRESQYVEEYIQTCEDCVERPTGAAGYAKGLARSRPRSRFGSFSSDDSQPGGHYRY